MNLKRIYLLLLVVVCCVAANAQAGKTIRPFKKGERVIFVGNSITHGGHYHSFIWLYYMTRFPKQPITVMNGGIGGECAWDIEKRLEDDVFDRNPTYVALTFGMNDTGYGIYNEPDAKQKLEQQIKKSYESYLNIEKMLQNKKAVAKVLIGGSPYDETTKFNDSFFPNKNEALLKIIDFQQASANKNNWGFVDFNKPMLALNLREQKKDPNFTFCNVDRIHPDNHGQMVMAYLFLKAQGLAGKKVAEVGIDASTATAGTQDNCSISGLKNTGNKLEFDYLAKALPYPIDTIPRHGWGEKKSQRDALTLVPFMEEFNQEVLKVTHLEKGEYQLKIDGITISNLSSAELSNGINLATFTNTPQYQQALKIMFLNEERFEVEKRFREYKWVEYTFLRKEGLLYADNREALDRINEALPNDFFLQMSYDNFTKAVYPEVRKVWKDYMEQIVSTIYKINQPVSHRFVLEKIQ